MAFSCAWAPAAAPVHAAFACTAPDVASRARVRRCRRAPQVGVRRFLGERQRLLRGEGTAFAAGSPLELADLPARASLEGSAGAEQSTGAAAPPAIVPNDKLRVPVLEDDSYLLPDEVDIAQQLATKWRLFWSPPWKKFRKHSVLSVELAGSCAEKASGGFPGPSPGQLASLLPVFVENLRKAAVDPRIEGVYIRLGVLTCGWAKIEELRRQIARFRRSGKFVVAFAEVCTEREMAVGSFCDEFYLPEEAVVSLRGFRGEGTFLGGVLEKIGVEAQVQRIGKYKSAGDQLGRKDMSEAQREVLGSLLDQRLARFKQLLAAHTGRGEEEVEALLEAAPMRAAELLDGRWITGVAYEDQVLDGLKRRVFPAQCAAAEEAIERASSPEEKEKAQKRWEKIRLGLVPAGAYAKLKPRTLGLDRRGKVVGAPALPAPRPWGALKAGSGGAGVGGDHVRGRRLAAGRGSGISSDAFVKLLRRVREDRRVAAVVLRIDSPGGSALASDVMWREIRRTAERKPVVASMSDVAASGGYYMSMACDEVFAEESTVTGSIGVVTAKVNLGKLYERVGYAKEVVSRGRLAELDVDNRPFTEEEAAYFAASARRAYESFRDKAAASRGMEPEVMEAYAQGRVWTGGQALERGLVDGLGGVDAAVRAARRRAGIPDEAPAAAPAGEAEAEAAGAASLLAALAQGQPLALLDGPAPPRPPARAPPAPHAGARRYIEGALSTAVARAAVRDPAGAIAAAQRALSSLGL
eukprot:tig00000663_g2987.t1